MNDNDLLIKLIADIRELIINDADESIQCSMMAKPECVLMFAKEWIKKANKDIKHLKSNIGNIDNGGF